MISIGELHRALTLVFLVLALLCICGQLVPRDDLVTCRLLITIY